jgi:hypothetical protein
LIRTVWLSLFFLIFLGGTAALKFVFGQPEPAKAAIALNLAASGHDQPTVGVSTRQDSPTKGDRLEVVYARPTTGVQLIPIKYAPDSPPQSAPPVVQREIVSRHWHDPKDPKVRQANDPKPKRKDVKKGSIAVQPKATTEASICPSDGFDVIRQAFNLSPSCR